MGAMESGALAVGNRVVLVVVGAAFIFVGASWGPETSDVDFDSMSPSVGPR
jgi:hypothetical protein